MNILKNRIEEVIEMIEVTTDNFYQQKENAGYNTLNVMLGKLINIVDELSIIEEGLNFDKEKFNSDLRETLNALEEKDTILLSDLLVYEIKEQLQEALEQLL